MFLFSHLELQHLFEVLPRLRISHFHLCDKLTERDPSTLVQVNLLRIDRQLYDMITLLQMFRILLFFAHEIVFLDIVAVNLILLGGGLLHAIEVAHLLNREVVGFKLISFLIERGLLLRGRSVMEMLFQVMGSLVMMGL